MTTSTLTLTDFLLARIAEDEREARMDDGSPAPIGMWDPERVLAECEAKRRIVEEHGDGGESQGYLADEDWRYGYMPHACETCGSFGEYGTPWPCRTLRALALPFADHPEYDESWRP
jgi:hypothetical protein